MHKLRRKLILSLVMMAFTAITLVSTTYAWFASNSEAWIDQYELQIENTDGLLASIDGVHYFTEISNDEVKQAVVAKKNGLDLSNPTDLAAFSAINYKDEFAGLKLAPVSTNNLVDFTTVTSASRKVNGYYEPYSVTHEYSYLEFDLWLKVETSQNQATKNYDISFVGTEDNSSIPYIKADDTSVKLSNGLTTPNTLFASGDTITVNPKNSMRIGIIHDDTETKTIYEPYMGYGSYALEQNLEDIYNPEKNAMFTYFNNSHNTKLKALSNDDVYKNTVKNFDEDVVFGRCVPNETKTDYEAIKITVVIWIEGYDADYFVGVDNTNAKFFLNFKMKEVINQ